MKYDRFKDAVFYRIQSYDIIYQRAVFRQGAVGMFFAASS